MIAKSNLKVRYSETDQMGIVHHSEYVKWFEVGRTDFIRELGQTYADIEKEGFYLPVIGVQVNYKTPAKYDDDIIILSSLDEYNGVRIKFYYEVRRASDDTLIVQGNTEHCWTNTSLRPTKLNRSWPELHKKLVDSMEK